MPAKRSEFRIAPSRSGRAAAFVWKYCNTGNEVYALSRNRGHLTKISIHYPGQILIHLGKDRQLLAGPFLMGGGSWLHAFETRFLLSEGILIPPVRSDNKGARLIEVPEGYELVLNLLLGRTECPNTECVNLDQLPQELSGAEMVWHARLRGGRHVVLTSRLFAMREENLAQIGHFRQEDVSSVGMTKPPLNPYIEMRRIHSNPKGNIVFVVPLGKEGYYKTPENPQSKQ